MKRASFMLVVGLMVLVTSGHGALVAPQSLLDLSQGADLIVVGTLTGVSQTGTAVTALLQVNRVLKGSPELSGSMVSAGWTSGSPQVGTDIPASATAGLWFLQGSPNGWTVLPAFGGNIPFSLTYFPVPPGPALSAYSYNPSAAVPDKIAAELCSAIESTNVYSSIQQDSLERGGLDVLASPYTALLYQRLAVSVSVPQQIIGLSGLIRQGDTPALSAAILGESAGFLSASRENGILLLSIRGHFRSADLSAIGLLGQAAADETGPTAFREAAAHALAAIHTSAALPYLAALFGDEDMDLRVEAIGGVGAFV